MPYIDEDFGRVVDQEWFSHASAVLLGRTTFQLMASYWPAVTDPDDRVTTVLNTYPKYVVSSTLTDETADWGESTVVSGDVAEGVRAALNEQQPDGELQVHGSWQLAHTLHDAGLVDIYRLLVFPTLVGGGKRLFPDGATPSGFRTVAHSMTAAGCGSLVLEPTQFSVGDHEVVEG